MWSHIQYIFIDEAQDITELLFAFICTLLNALARIGTFPQLVCVGDLRQEIYGFRGSSSGYLLHAEHVFPNPKQRPWAWKTLSMSYRLTPSMAWFVNTLCRYDSKLPSRATAAGAMSAPLALSDSGSINVGSGATISTTIGKSSSSTSSSSTISSSKIASLKSGHIRVNKDAGNPVEYWVGNPWKMADLLCEEIALMVKSGKLQSGDIMFVANSIRRANEKSPLRHIENGLVEAGILCYTPEDEMTEEGADPALSAGKVLFTTVR